MRSIDEFHKAIRAKVTTECIIEMVNARPVHAEGEPYNGTREHFAGLYALSIHMFEKECPHNLTEFLDYLYYEKDVEFSYDTALELTKSPALKKYVSEKILSEKIIADLQYIIEQVGGLKVAAELASRYFDKEVTTIHLDNALKGKYPNKNTKNLLIALEDSLPEDFEFEHCSRY